MRKNNRPESVLRHLTQYQPEDLLIAAHARSLGLTRITNNISKFVRAKNLRVENWV